MSLIWSYGITTVPQRRTDHLPRTISSLSLAGFDQPRLFVDGCPNSDFADYTQFGLATTFRYPAVSAYGNWILSLTELFLREPLAHRFALLQDDILAVRNLRSYLEQSPYPKGGYLNLFTFMDSEGAIAGKSVGWHEASTIRGQTGSPVRWQVGKGALALIFDRKALIALLTNQASVRHLALRVLDVHRGRKGIDGGVVTAMNKSGFREYVHNPSLVQHAGGQSTVGNPKYPLALTFPGEDYDALQLLRDSRISEPFAPSQSNGQAVNSHDESERAMVEAALAADLSALPTAFGEKKMRLLQWVRVYRERLAALAIHKNS